MGCLVILGPFLSNNSGGRDPPRETGAEEQFQLLVDNNYAKVMGPILQDSVDGRCRNTKKWQNTLYIMGRWMKYILQLVQDFCPTQKNNSRTEKKGLTIVILWINLNWFKLMEEFLHNINRYRVSFTKSYHFWRCQRIPQIGGVASSTLQGGLEMNGLKHGTWSKDPVEMRILIWVFPKIGRNPPNHPFL